MADKERVLKSGQLTLSRLLFLAIIGGLVVAMVYFGGVWLSVGYWVITLAICAVLFLVAIDYGAGMDKASLTAEPAQAGARLDAEPRAAIESPAAREARVRRRTTRAAKRRR